MSRRLRRLPRPSRATGSFADQPNVLVYLAAAGLVGMVTSFPTAAEFGKRSILAGRRWEKITAEQLAESFATLRRGRSS